MSKGWDSIALKKLKALTGKGLSTSEIGKRLGMSKNAIVGKLNRLGWNAKATGLTAKQEPAKKVAEKPAKKAAAKPADKKTVKKAEKPAKTTATKKVATKPAAKIITKTASPKKETVKKATAKPASTAETKKTTTQSAQTTKESKSASAKNLAMHQRIIQHSLEMANLKPNQCRWPIGDPDSEHFHFCGETVFVGKPYCYEHCKQAYQFTPPKKK